MTEPVHGSYPYSGQPHSKTDPLANRAYWGAAVILLLGILVPVLYYLTVYGTRTPSAPERPSPREESALSGEEERLLRLINEARAKEPGKRPPLKPDPTLFRVAREHAANMARQRMPADKLEGKDTTVRVLEAGYKANENWLLPSCVTSPTLTAEEMFQSWMADPETKAKMLDEHFTETGIGIARGDDGIGYGYQIIAAPQK